MPKTINPIVISQKYKGLLNEIFNLPTTKTKSLNAKFDYFNIAKFRVKLEGSCLKTIAKPCTPNKIINLYIVYEIKLWPFHNTAKFAVRNSVF